MGRLAALSDALSPSAPRRCRRDLASPAGESVERGEALRLWIPVLDSGSDFEIEND
jgi:hypothetical protein